MPATIRLQRVGRKGQGSFRIVVAEKSKARNGPAIETLGVYNPRTHPSLIRFDGVKALQWMRKGAVPSQSVEAIFRRTGVLAHFRSGAEPEALEPGLIDLGPEGTPTTSRRPKPRRAAPKAKPVEAAPAAQVAGVDAAADAEESGASGEDADAPTEETSGEEPSEEGAPSRD